ncbi:hypothetical protein [Azospirillum sp. ST 5-10]|uniref:hypothetical protein n=1 Tax=unclassified Azospirillum TaxID=2630922 RepID=UPI003F4A13F1
MSVFALASPAGWGARLVRRLRAASRPDALRFLEPHDRRAVLAEAGLGEHDLPVLRRAGHVRELLPAALDLHGIDGAALDDDRPDVLNDLNRVCAHCTSTRACADLLAAGAARDAHARLCPNAGTLESLRPHPASR